MRSSEWSDPPPRRLPESHVLKPCTRAGVVVIGPFRHLGAAPRWWPPGNDPDLELVVGEDIRPLRRISKGVEYVEKISSVDRD